MARKLSGFFFAALLVLAHRTDSAVIRSIVPRVVGLHGGARLVIRGGGFQFFPARVPDDLVLVGDEPCIYIKARSHPKGHTITCVLPPMASPGLAEVVVNGTTCDECSVKYTEGLVPKAWVTSPPGAENVVSGYSAGDHVPLLLSGSFHHVMSTEQFIVTVGGVSVALTTHAFGDDVDMGDSEGYMRRVVEDLHADTKPPMLLLSLPLPTDIAAGTHELTVVIDRARPEVDVAHGQVAFIDATDDKAMLSLAITVLPMITAVSHARVGTGGGNEIIIDGGGFGALPEDNDIVLGGRPCEVISGSFMRLRCRLSGAGGVDTSSQRFLAVTDGDIGVHGDDDRLRGMSLHLWHLVDSLDSVAGCLRDAADAFESARGGGEKVAVHSGALGGLAVCLAGADGLASDGPADGFRLAAGLSWPPLDLPRSLDYGPGMWLTPDHNGGSRDTFVGAGAAMFHPPVSGWYCFTLDAGGLPAVFVVGSEVRLRTGQALQATVWFDQEEEYPAFLAVGVDEQGRQARVAVDFRASHSKHRQGMGSGEGSTGGLVASGSTVSLSTVPSSWFTGLRLHAPGHDIANRLEHAGHRRRLKALEDARGSGPVPASLRVGGAPALCRGTVPGACGFAVDASLTPHVRFFEFYETSGIWTGGSDRLLGGMFPLRPTSPSIRVIGTGSGFHTAHHAVSKAELPAREWERQGFIDAALVTFDPPSLFALAPNGESEDILLCRGEETPSSEATSFSCTIDLPTCEGIDTSLDSPHGERKLGVFLSGGGWAELDSPTTVPWPLPCMPSSAVIASRSNEDLGYGAWDAADDEESRRLFDISSDVGVRRWSEVLQEDFNGLSNKSDVTVASGETLIIDADMDCQYLIVEGSLRWNTSIGGLTLNTAGVIVLSDGSFELGTEDNPMMLTATVRIKSLNDTLDYTIADDDYTAMDDFDAVFDDASGSTLTVDPYLEVKDVVGLRPFVAYAIDNDVTRPKIVIAGRPLKRTWTQLAASAEAGSSVLWLEHDPYDLGWRAGDEISLAGSVAKQSYTHVIKALRNATSIGCPEGSAGGVILTEGIMNFATGNLRASSSYGGPTVRVSTEVGLLSRSVVITGGAFDKISSGPLGMHMMVAYQGLLQVSYAAFDHCGQKDITGRYCTHMHVLGSCFDCIVKGNSYNDAWMAAITVHGTHHTLVTENVIHTARGAGIYVEDGNEINNTISYNTITCLSSTVRAPYLTHNTSISRFCLHPSLCHSSGVY